MRRLIYLDSALDDLDRILGYIATQSQSLDVAWRFTQALRGQCAKLASLPGTLGRPRPELQPGLRSFAIQGHVIFFRYRDDALEIVNLLHGHRDIDSFFGEPP